MAYNRTNLSATTAASAARFVSSANMLVGTYTVANGTTAHGAGGLVTVTHTQVGGVTDTLGTITIVGTDLAGATQTETITPISASVATSTKIFKTVTSATGAGWVINSGNDTVTIGHAADAYVAAGSGEFYAIVVNATTATTIAISDAAGTIATLKASIGEGTYYFQCNFGAHLKITHAGTSNYTVLHTASLPTTYA